MALRVAVANGNWSNPAIWNGGVKPTVGDVVASNNFTVTIDENINVDSITNTARTPIKVTPDMTGYTTPSGIVTSSSESGTDRAAWKAFDGNGGTIAQVATANTGWIAYEFPVAIVINGYSWTTGGSENPRNWTFEGWDGAAWIILHTVTGNTGGYTSPAIGNNTAYIKYRVNVTVTNTTAQRPLWYEINLFERYSETAAVTGGGFILNDGVTVTCTGSTSISSASSTCLTYAGSNSATITCSGNIVTPSTSGVRTINITSGTLDINALNLLGGLAGTNRYAIQVSGIGTTLNYTGRIDLGGGDYGGITALAETIINVIGDCIAAGGSNHSAVLFSGSQLNVTGLIQGGRGGGSSTFGILASSGTINVTGDVEGSINIIGNAGVFLNGQVTINVLGKIAGKAAPGLSTSQIIYLNHIGTVESSRDSTTTSNVGLSSTNAGSINILTGPFISHPIGIQPLYVTRMHYRRTMGSYYEFRDNSTLGALPPSPPAPATRLVSPDTVADSPVPRDVRQGTIYAEGSQTGTMIVPSRDNVAKGVLVDNTVGTAILDADSIWAVPLTSINTLNSIGRRVKNAATVETTGAQIQQTLNDNE
jgi:hypothetical protein